MKKTLSVILAVSICLCSLFSSAMIASATTTIDENTVDLTKSVVVPGGNGKTTLDLPLDSTGVLGVTMATYNHNLLFNNDGSYKTGGLWLGGAMVALKYANGNAVTLDSGKKYAINIEYDVVLADSGDYPPQIALTYKTNNFSTPESDNAASTIIAARSHEYGKTGSYTLSAVASGLTGNPIRLAFSGQGKINIKSVVLSVCYDEPVATTIDLSKSTQIIAEASRQYTDFSVATDTEPLKLTMKSGAGWNPLFKNKAEDNIVKDGNQNWLKTLISLKKSDGSYYKLKTGYTYNVTVQYKFTSSIETSDPGYYPGIAVVYNNHSSNDGGDNGAKILIAKRTSPASNMNTMLTLNGSFAGANGTPLRLAFQGRSAAFEVYSVTVTETKNVPDMPAVTFNNNGNTTSAFYENGSTLPTLENTADAVFAGWVDSQGNKVETVNGDVNVTALYLTDSKVDFSKSVVVPGKNGSITLTTPEDSDGNLGVSVGTYNNNLLFNGDSFKTNGLWLGGSMATLMYDISGKSLTLNSGKKYAINVEYDLVSANSFDYPAQIALAYKTGNFNEPAKDNATTMLLAATKHEYGKTGSYTLSAVATGLNGNPLRLAFAGQGEFIIKSISIEEAASGSTTDYAVKFVDKNGNINTAQLVNPTDPLPVINNTLTENFAGWYNGDTKVENISADGTLTAKWLDKDDANGDEEINVLDFISVKLALELGKTDSFYDLNRDGVFDEKDIDYMLRVNLDVAEITLGENNVKDYVICNEMDSSLIANKALTALNAFFNEKTGVELPVVASTDADKVITLKVDTALATDAYAITLSDGKLTVAGGSDYAVNAAVNSLIKRFEATETLAADYSEEGNCEAMLDGYKLAWGDEFDGTALDTAKWTVSTETQNGPFYTADSDYYKATSGAATWTQNGSYKQDGVVNYVDDDYTVSDGVLTMNTRKTDAGYSATKISSNKQFRYGLMEAKIKFGAGEGATYTFWSRSVDGAEKETSVVNEFDFVENFGTKDIRGNLHTWKKWGDEHINHGSNIDTRETVENAVDGEYHYIAMEWTDSVVKFYFDGELYLEQDITDEATWEAFRNSTYLILGIAVPTGSYAIDSNGTTPAEVLGDISSFSDSMSVDYVRIFQN